MPAWSDVRRAFVELLALPEAERRGRVAGIAPGDPELAEELLSLLAHDLAAECSPGFLACALDGSDGAIDRVGPYELLRELGHDGSGVRYLVRRAGAPSGFQVLLHRAATDSENHRYLERFRRDQRRLVGLMHKGFARPIDGGVAQDGSLYLVTEFVEGQAIDVYCDGEGLTLTQRLELVLEVGETLQQVHQRLVVHGQLSPSNLRVNAVGETKLLGLGLAPWLALDVACGASARVAGTESQAALPYSSPEQRAGLALAASSDVYSLGVLLHGLLSGALPESHRVESFGGESFGDGDSKVSTVWVTPPSSVLRALDAETLASRARVRGTTGAGLIRALDGDLDAVLASALRAAGSTPYGSVEALGRDLRAHLEGRPVDARSAGRRYRTSKFWSRNRVAVLVAAPLLVALAVLGHGSVSSRLRAERMASAWDEERGQRRVAEARLAGSEQRLRRQEAQRSLLEERLHDAKRRGADLRSAGAGAREAAVGQGAQMRSLVLDLHARLARAGAPGEAREVVVEVGSEHLDRWSARAQGDPALQRELALGYMTIAELQSAPGAPGRSGPAGGALASAEKALQLALRCVEADPQSAASRLVFGSALALEARLHVAVGEEEQGVAGFRAALDACASVDPAVAGLERLDLEILCRLSLFELLRERFAPPAARSRLLECEALLEQVAGLERTPRRAVDLQWVRVHLAALAVAPGAGQEELAPLRGTMGRLEELAFEAAEDVELASKVRRARANAGRRLLELGVLGTASEWFSANRMELEAARRIDGTNPELRMELLAAQCDTMDVHALKEEWAAALCVGVDAVGIAREGLAREPGNRRVQVRLARALCGLARSQRQLGLQGESLERLVEARELLERPTSGGADLLEARCELSRVYAELGRVDRALADRSDTDVHDARRKLTEAIGWFTRALDQAEKLGEAVVVNAALDAEGMRREIAQCRDSFADRGK